jgi:hypothetical protein
MSASQMLTRGDQSRGPGRRRRTAGGIKPSRHPLPGVQVSRRHCRQHSPAPTRTRRVPRWCRVASNAVDIPPALSDHHLSVPRVDGQGMPTGAQIRLQSGLCRRQRPLAFNLIPVVPFSQVHNGHGWRLNFRRTFGEAEVYQWGSPWEDLEGALFQTRTLLLCFISLSNILPEQ